MEDRLNYSGAAVFWLYILAALCLSALVIHSLIAMGPPDRNRQAARKHDQIVFGSLALVSFTILSVNMLQVLIQSFTAWSKVRLHDLPTTPMALVWTWSVTSTLFLDFAEALVQSDARFRWAASSLIMTFGICVFMGIEGSRHRIPRLWAFFALSQILPISFTQNLFYLAMLRAPPERTHAVVINPLWKVSILAAVYSGAVSVLPVMAGSVWLTPVVLITRVLLFLPQQLFKSVTQNRGTHTKSRDINQVYRISPWACAAVAGLGVLLLPVASSSNIYATIKGMKTALFAHPAVTTLGCDFILSLTSFNLWHWRQGRR